MSRLQSLIRDVVALEPDADAVEANGRWRSWRELKRRMDALEQACAELDLGADARVAVMLRNRIGPYAALAFMLAGERCLVTLNPAYPPHVLAEDIRTLRPPLVIGEASDFEAAELRQALLESGSAVIQLPDDAHDRARMLEGFEKPRPRDDDWTRPGTIIEMLTSGTTGKPKRVPLARRGFEEAFDRAIAAQGHSGEARLSDNVQLLTGPISHIGGIWHTSFQLTSGRKACLLEKFTVESWRDAVVRHRPKSAATPPAALRMILQADLPKDDLSSLSVLTSGTAPLDWATVDEVWARYGIPVLTNYGATESSGAPIAAWTLADFRRYRESKRGSVGRLQRGVEGRVVAPDTGEPVPHGVEGVLEVRGAQMAAPSGQWMRTTDRAVLDEDDFLWIRGRTDNAIIRGGFKVHPDDIARALERHPDILEAAVVGIPDGRLGEVPHAAVVLNEGAAAPSDAELSMFLRERLTPYQIPVAYHYMQSLPRTTSMKPALTTIRELLSRSRSS